MAKRRRKIDSEFKPDPRSATAFKTLRLTRLQQLRQLLQLRTILPPPYNFPPQRRFPPQRKGPERRPGRRRAAPLCQKRKPDKMKKGPAFSVGPSSILRPPGTDPGAGG